MLGAETEIGQCMNCTAEYKYYYIVCFHFFVVRCLNEIWAKFGKVLQGVIINTVNFCHWASRPQARKKKDREIAKHKINKHDLLGYGIEN